jgi:hypothetical protein
LIAGAIGWYGSGHLAETVAEISNNRPPLVYGLKLINEVQMALKTSNRHYENDDYAQPKFVDDSVRESEKDIIITERLMLKAAIIILVILYLFSMRIMCNILMQWVNQFFDAAEIATKRDFSTKMNLNGKADYSNEQSDTAFKDSLEVSQTLKNDDLDQTVTRNYQAKLNQAKQCLTITVYNRSQATGEQAESVEETRAYDEQMSVPIKPE